MLDAKALTEALRAAGVNAELVPDSGPEPPAATPTYTVHGFTLNVGLTTTFYACYTVAGNVVGLQVSIQLAGGPLALWRAFETPRSQAVEQAHRLADDTRAYAATISRHTRPSEILTLDDFVEHLRLRLEGGFV